jgi:uncharacterized protein YbjT (DUF2867 family)
MSKLLVIIGATGKQGGSVINAVLSDPTAKSQFAIRGVSRSVDGKGAQALKDQGVEVVAGDLNDKESLVKAFKGAYAVFGVTDYWQGAGMDMKKEYQQGKNIVDAVKVRASPRAHKDIGSATVNELTCPGERRAALYLLHLDQPQEE